MSLLFFEYTFEMDDLSNEVYVEGGLGGDDVVKVTEYLESILDEPWFVQGNKTEGTLTITGGDHIDLEWKSINMEIEDGDIFDDSTDHKVQVGVNTPKWSKIFGETEIV